MAIRGSFVIIALFYTVVAVAQKPAKDTLSLDSTFTDYDFLFSELDAFLDSITAPRTFALINVGLTPGSFSEVMDDYEVKTEKRLVFTPSFTFFHKSGFGLGAEASLVHDGQQLNPFQYAFTATYDYLQNDNYITGLSYTHFVTQKDLAFYTSPLRHQLFGYFTWRDFWLKSSVGVSYGWGSREDFKDREDKIIAMQLAARGFTRTNTRETVNDLSLLASVRHDFYKLSLLGEHDYFRFTPQISFSSGTHQFGFNQTSNSYATVTRTGTRILYDTETVSLDNNLYFQPLSLTGFLKLEYGVKKFFIQPQVSFDYYFPAKQDNFLTTWIVNAGFIF